MDAKNLNLLKNLVSKSGKLVKEFLLFILDWKTVLCYLPFWFIAVGWTYTAILLGNDWVKIVASAWLTILWMPWCPEKLITVPLALWLKSILFKRENNNNNMATQNIKLVKQVFQDIADIVTPTMGAKGRMAVINDEFGRPILTDDGVTVAKNLRDSYKDFSRMIAISMIEAASNTERTAYDGTTLTVLLTNEIYKLGLKMIKKGMHPQVVADKIQLMSSTARDLLEKERYLINTKNQIYQVAYITTKMPTVGALVAEAYNTAGKDMNVLIEHDRINTESSIEHVDGMVLDAGYYSEVMQKLCNKGNQSEFEKAHVALLAEGMLTGTQCKNFFMSIPNDARKDPFVFIIPAGFNPESLRMLTDTLISNKFIFQFVFINDKSATELFLDLEAKTQGYIQDASRGTSDYIYEDCGYVDKITIGLDKTTIISQEDPDRLKERIDKYRKELEDDKYTMTMIRQGIITRRLANITEGITTIKIACPTVTEFITIKLKLDDAIGAVKCAIRDGVVLGGGKALYYVGTKINNEFRKVLKAPLKTICKNAGIKISHKWVDSAKANGYNVITGKAVKLDDEGIIDSFTSIDAALNNATSIASQYLRAFILINK